MTKWEFIKRNELKAFEIAEKQHVWDETSRYNVARIAAEAQLILEEWWDDYCQEHV